jgi:hypothetical protein
MSGDNIIDLEGLASGIVEAARESISEEDLRIRVEHILQELVVRRVGGAGKGEIPLASWRPPRARYEVTLVSGVRLDALYGHLIIEYEKPGAFGSRAGFERAVEQIKQYIRDHAQTEARYPRYFGVVMDGYRVGFVRYREALRGFEGKGPFEINKNTVAKLVEAIIGLRRKALSPEELLKDFGPDSVTARETVKVFYSKLMRASPKTKVLFDDWRRVFSQVCAYSPDKIKGLGDFYGFGKNRLDPEKLLFALQTYYALIMKLLAAEVASLYLAPRIWSYLRMLEEAYYRGHEELREKLRELEEGGVFASLGITNFMEADYFAWYLDDWDADIAKSVMRVVNTLSDYDPTIAELEPERVRDLFKRLYQNLVPKKIRHDLGEYYTPDWLAEFVLNEVGWTLENFEKLRDENNDALSPLNLRLLDPACGSGTFLVLAMGRLRHYIEEHWVDKGAALRRITKNIVGFDLNPLAVIASRTNYLIALGDMLRERGAEPIEIPVYLADSILVERKGTLTVNTYALTTAVGIFEIPTRVIEGGLLIKVLKILEECVRGNYTSNEFKGRLLREVSLDDAEVSVLVDLFNVLSKLEREGKNRIWTRILKNSFAPFFTGIFDYVVGNPPWIAWENLPDDYRDATEDLWNTYGLSLTLGTGAFKKDMAMLFVARCMDRYVKDGGIFSFLIPFTLFKTRAGAGFRQHIARRYTVAKVIDLVTLYPFEGATNRTSLIVLKKSGKTVFPIPCEIWHNPRSGGIDTRAELKQIKELTRQFKLSLIPIEFNKPESPWMQITEKAYEAIKKVIGKSPWYEAHAGTCTELNQVYWIKILARDADGYLITNELEHGQKKRVRQTTTKVEGDLIFPLIRGRDVKRYYVEAEIDSIIIPNDPSTGRPIHHKEMKVKYPKTWAYFYTYFNELIDRRGAFLKDKLIYYKTQPFQKAEEKTIPFYYVMNTGDYTFAPYKVVWKRIAGGITGKATSFAACVIGKIDGKPVIPNDSLIMIPFSDQSEAYYVSAVLNSSIIRLAIASYTYELRQETHITRYIRIPKFDTNNSLHRDISALSSKAHLLASKYYGVSDMKAYEELSKVEDGIDKCVAQLYNINDEELKEIKRCLAMLEGEEMEVEEIIEASNPMPEISIDNPVLYKDSPQELELTVANPYDKPLENVKIKFELDGITYDEVLDKVLGTHQLKIKIPLDRLDAGEYRAKVSMEYLLEGSASKIEKEIPVYVKELAESLVKRGGLDDLLGDLE